MLMRYAPLPVVAILACGATALRAVAQPLGTDFTFQGRLKQSGTAVVDLCDFQFRLFDSLTGGVQIGPTLTYDGVGGNPPPVSVVDGLLTVKLDFGVGVFQGDQRFLDIAVRCPTGAGGYTPLMPRQPIYAAPYALYALDSPPDFNLPLAVTIPSDQDLLSLTNSMAGGSGGGALVARSSGTSSPALRGVALGTARAGLFECFVPGSTTEVLEVFTTSDGTAIEATTHGNGSAGVFLNGIATNAATALEAKTIGTGRAGHFELANTASNNVALKVDSDANGDALHSAMIGSARAGFFEINVPVPANNASDALESLTNGAGRAGLFQINVPTPSDNNSSALTAGTNGAARAGFFEINVPSAAANTAPALEAITNANGRGVMGFAPNHDGVFGRTNKSATFVINPAAIRGGVHGEGAIGSTADNFAVVGTQSSYGTGVLGVGESGGYGVVGVPGSDEAGKSLPGVWGMTREGVNGAATWPPHFPIGGTLGPKGTVGVLGQAYNKVGVWGESIQDIGVVGTTGPATGFTPNLAAGVYGAAGLNINSPASYFERRGSTGTLFNTAVSAALVATTNNAGGPAGLFLKPSAGADLYPALYAQSIGSSAAAVFRQQDVAFQGGSFSGATVHVHNARPSGIGLDVQLTSSANTSPAMQAISSATSGWAGFFTNGVGTATSSTVQVLSTTSANCLLVNNGGTSGRVARFSRSAANTFGGGVEIDIVGTGVALDVIHRGAGIGLNVEKNPPSTSPAAVISNNHADGRALRVVNNVATSATSGSALEVVGPSTFFGDVGIGGAVTTGTLCATSVCAAVKNFQIDHPLDPENKYLRHSSIESSEMLNIYSGNLVTDEHGYATVVLPAWFEALNTDFRYQLTAIGEFAQAIVAERIRDGRFVVRTDKPRVEVSWQVTGVRQDAYAKAHPLAVEVDKPEGERGKNRREPEGR